MRPLNELMAHVVEAAKERRRHAKDPAEARQQARLAFLARRDAERALLAPRIAPSVLSRIRTTETASAVILGGTGVGKTTAAKWLLAGRRYLFMDAQTLANTHRSWPLGKGDDPATSRSMDAKLLIVDDIGSERDPMALQTVLRHRYNNQRPTIVTSGLTEGALVEWLGAPYVRRLCEQHAGFPVLLVDSHGD